MACVSQFPSELISIAYDNIHNLVNKHKAGLITKNDTFNFYGVVTFIKQSERRSNMHSVTLVDPSCTEEEKLKCNIFSGPTDLNKIESCWEIGDIIRCHRFDIKTFNDQPQGCGDEKKGTWTRFKRNDDDYEFKSSKNTTIDEKTQKKVKELREWLKSNPANQYLYEAKLSENVVDVTLWKNEDYTTNNKLFNHYLQNLKLAQFSRIHSESYTDIICQVCAICKIKDVSFLIVWDGTQTKYAIHQESDFQVKKTIKNEPLYHQDLKENGNLFQIYIFDEYVQLLENIEPGDYILLRNLKVTKPNQSAADYILKLCGDNENARILYKRCLLKLADFKADTSHLTDYNQVVTIIESIKLKGKELQVGFVGEDAFIAEFRSFNMVERMDQTFDELAIRAIHLQKTSQNKIKLAEAKQVPNTSELNQPQGPKTVVDKLLDDDEEQYSITDDDEDDSFKSTVSNKENLNKNHQLDSPNNETTRVLRSDTRIPNKTSTQALQSPNKRSPTKRPFPQNCSTLETFTNLSPHMSRIEGEKELSPMSIDQYVQPTKKVKYYDNFETCEEIHQLDKRLVNFTYIAPLLMGDIEQLNKITSIPFFLSIADFKNEMQSKCFMRAKVEAQVFDYAKYCPPFACIYVTCKKCQYINFAPFHFIGSKKPNILKNMTEDYETEIGETQPCFSTDDQNQLKRQESSKNFSLRWLNTAEPGSITQNEGSDVPVMNYICPRCALNYSDADTYTDTQENSMDTETLRHNNLEFSLRFWLNLKDHTGSLVPCLLEGGALNRFLDGISAIDFFTVESKKQQVYRTFHALFSPSNKYLFTIDSFRLRKKNPKVNQNRPEFLNKIVLFQELTNIC